MDVFIFVGVFFFCHWFVLLMLRFWQPTSLTDTHTHTHTGFAIASTILLVMLRLALVATAGVVRGSSAITVFSPTLEMSLNLSESENMLEQRELIMTSI